MKVESKIELSKRKIYVSSYYQSKEHKEAFDKSLSLQSEEAVAINKKLVEEEILVRGILQVSQANYEKLAKIKCCYAPSSDYIVGLQCDIEVAIQEEKLRRLADKFGFKFIDETDVERKSPLEYKERYRMDEVTLDQKDLIQGNVYVINTHGEKQQIDGPYHQALVKGDIQRILVDACSSADSGNRGSRSVIERVADDCIAEATRKHDFQILGYKSPFDTQNSRVTAVAAFATEKKIWQEEILTLITLEDRRNQLMVIQKEEQDKARQEKLKNLAKATENTSEKDALKKSLIGVSSKILSSIFLPTNPSLFIKNIKEKAKMFVANITGEERFKAVVVYDKNLIRQIREEKKNYINSLEDEKKLVGLAMLTIEMYALLPHDNDNSIDLLKALVEKYEFNVNEEQKLKNLESEELSDYGYYTPTLFSPAHVRNVNTTTASSEVENLRHSGFVME